MVIQLNTIAMLKWQDSRSSVLLPPTNIPNHLPRAVSGSGLQCSSSSVKPTPQILCISFKVDILKRYILVVCVRKFTTLIYWRLSQYILRAFPSIYAPFSTARKVRRRGSQKAAQRVNTPRMEATQPKTRVPMSSGPH